jgi:WD40 repeat protein
VYVTSSNDVRAYAVASGAAILTFAGHTAPVTGVVEHPSFPKQLVTSSLDGTLRSWDVDDGACLRIIRIGVPITRLCAPALHPNSSSPLVYIAAALRRGEEGDGYPLGDEVACLRPRPLATSFAYTVSESGHSRATPKSAVFEVDWVHGKVTRRIGGHDGFVVGLDGRCHELAGGGLDRTVVFALRRRLYVWRSGPSGAFQCDWCTADV